MLNIINILQFYSNKDYIKGPNNKSIKPEQNLLIASLQTNSAFHDVNPVKNIIGQRNTAYAAIHMCGKVSKEILSIKNIIKIDIKKITDKFFTFILTFIKKLKLKYL